MKKTLITIALTGLIGLSNCGEEQREISYEAYEEGVAEKNKYEFTSFEELANIEDLRLNSVYHIESADLDNDGDLDLIIGRKKGGIIAYENKINPSKKDSLK